jgi:hypothetical protein
MEALASAAASAAICHFKEVIQMASLRRTYKRAKMFSGMNAKQKKLRRQELKAKREDK